MPLPPPLASFKSKASLCVETGLITARIALDSVWSSLLSLQPPSVFPSFRQSLSPVPISRKHITDSPVKIMSEDCFLCLLTLLHLLRFACWLLCSSNRKHTVGHKKDLHYWIRTFVITTRTILWLEIAGSNSGSSSSNRNQTEGGICWGLERGAGSRSHYVPLLMAELDVFEWFAQFQKFVPTSTRGGSNQESRNHRDQCVLISQQIPLLVSHCSSPTVVSRDKIHRILLVLRTIPLPTFWQCSSFFAD